MSKPEVSITYEPFKKIVIMEKTFFNTPEDIARFTSVIAGGKLAGLYWVEGVVFLYFPLPASTAVVAKELLETARFTGPSLVTRLCQSMHRSLKLKKK